MNIDKKLEILKKIEEVETPPFLITRIKQRINTLSAVQAPVKWKWSFAVIGLLLLVLNISIVLKSQHASSSKGITTIVTGFHLSTTNNFYNE